VRIRKQRPARGVLVIDSPHSLQAGAARENGNRRRYPLLTKRSLIVALAGVNLFLLGALLLSASPLPTAYAQRVGGSSNYIAVACEADDSYDVFYVVDLPARRLHAFIASRRQDGALEYAGNRDLEKDFRRAQ